jgi:hypothetical protein
MIGKHFTQEMELMEATDVGLYTEDSLLVFIPLFGQNLKTDYFFRYDFIPFWPFLVCCLVFVSYFQPFSLLY